MKIIKSAVLTLFFAVAMTLPHPVFAQYDYAHPMMLIKNGLPVKVTEVYISDADQSGWGEPSIKAIATRYSGYFQTGEVA